MIRSRRRTSTLLDGLASSAWAASEHPGLLERGGRPLPRRAHPLAKSQLSGGQDRAAQFRRGARRFDQIGAVAITRAPCSQTSGGH